MLSAPSFDDFPGEHTLYNSSPLRTPFASQYRLCEGLFTEMSSRHQLFYISDYLHVCLPMQSIVLARFQSPTGNQDAYSRALCGLIYVRVPDGMAFDDEVSRVSLVLYVSRYREGHAVRTPRRPRIADTHTRTRLNRMDDGLLHLI